LSHSSNRVGGSVESPSGSRKSTQNRGSLIQRILAPKSDSSPYSSAVNNQAAELPNSAPSRFFASSDPAEFSSVTVQLGNTFREIIVRVMGRYDDELVDQIRKLNPAITNFDRIETGQVIRLPRNGKAVVSAPASESAAAAGKN
jgi:hypothetical protein